MCATIFLYNTKAYTFSIDVRRGIATLLLAGSVRVVLNALFYDHYIHMRLSSFLCCVSNTYQSSDSHTRLKRQDKKPGTSSKTNSQPGLEPYSAGQASNLFQQYADKDDRNVIGPEGFERLCTDAEIPMDGVAPLLLAWQLGSTELAKIKKTEWDKGTEELR